MISLVMFLLVLILVVYLLHALFTSGMTFFVNIVIIILAATRASGDLKKGKMYAYYLASALATTIVFISIESRPIKPIFTFLGRAHVLPMSIALVFIIFFAHMFKLSRIYGIKYGKQGIEASKKKVKELFSK